MVVKISPHQFSICQEASGQFCNIITPFQLLANLPSCITALYTKNAPSIFARCHCKSGKLKMSLYPLKLQPMFGY